MPMALRRSLQPDAPAGRADAPERAAMTAAVARDARLRPGCVERLVDGVGLLLGDRAVGDEPVERFADPVVVVVLGGGAQRAGQQDPGAEGRGAAHPESIPAVHRRVLSLLSRRW